MTAFRVFLGWDASQMRAWNVAQFSLRTKASVEVDVRRIAMPALRAAGLYRRPTQVTEHGYWDEISGAPMSTGHAIARFLVPALCEYKGWALFTDGDVLFRADVGDLFALADPTKAIQVVQHAHDPRERVKMEGHAQTTYARKNWSSVILWNCGHPSNQKLTVDLVNRVPGRDLHRFCWLDDSEIGALPARWNVLIGTEADPDPALVHFTEGLPDMAGYEHCAFAEDWYAVARGAGYRLRQPEKAGAA
jgi:hypothetical protein